jgi:hypothetical protein
VSPTSDHRPDEDGWVRAIDFGGPADWLDSVAEAMRLSADERIRYLIHDNRIYSFYAKGDYPPFTWRPYAGYSPHTEHIHVSIRSEFQDGVDAWSIEEDDVAQFDAETAEVLQRVADNDKVDRTVEGGVFEGPWKEATASGLMSAYSEPTDLVSKQEFAALSVRLVNLFEAGSAEEVAAELAALKDTLRSV